MAAQQGNPPDTVAVIHGTSGAGPLVIDVCDEPGLVHIGWPGGGGWFPERQVGRLIVGLVRALDWPPDPDAGPIRVATFEYGEEDS